LTNNSIQVFRGGWDNVQNAKILETLSLASNTYNSIKWKPDLSRFYFVNQSNEVIEEFTPITPGVITGATMTGTSPNFSSLEGNMTAIWWNRPGTILYMIGINNRIVYQLNASTPYDVTTLTDSGLSFDPPESINPTGLYFMPDNITWYLASIFSNDMIFEYKMGTPGVISTSVNTANRDISSETTSVRDVFFNPNQRLMYTLGANEKKIFIYRFGILGDITSTVLIDELELDVTEAQYRGMFISLQDGNKLYVIKNNQNEIETYNISLETISNLLTKAGEEFVTKAGELLVAK